MKYLALGLAPLAALVLSQACFNSDCSETNDCFSSAGTSGTTGGSGSDTGGSGGSGGSNGGTNTGPGGTAGSVGGSAGASGGSAGETGGSGGSGGTGGTEACNGECDGDTPECDEVTMTCVQCTDSVEHCTEHGLTVCVDNACVECDTRDECEAPTPECDDSNTCVECTAQEHCPLPDESRCTEEGSCDVCVTNDDCAHILNKNVCDGGTCVECTVATEATACGGKSCNPATKACTDTDVGTVGDCRPCVADSECVGGNQVDADRRCVPMEFDGVLRDGGFCLKRGSKTCVRPYFVPITAVSLSGAASEAYCGIDEDNVRCEAVLDLVASRTCAAASLDTECGCARDGDGLCTEEGSGGLCRDLQLADDQCTYQCGAANQCPVGFGCAGDPVAFCQ